VLQFEVADSDGRLTMKEVSNIRFYSFGHWGGIFPALNPLERDADNSPPGGVEAKNEWSFISVPPYTTMASHGQRFACVSVLSHLTNRQMRQNSKRGAPVEPF
jgi:hypothetical protein